MKTKQQKLFEEHDFKHEYQLKRRIESNLTYDLIITRNTDQDKNGADIGRFLWDLVLEKVNTSFHTKYRVMYIECEECSDYWRTGNWPFPDVNFLTRKVYKKKIDNLPVLYIRTSVDQEYCVAMLIDHIRKDAKKTDNNNVPVCKIDTKNKNIVFGWDNVFNLIYRIINKNFN